jgi:hypothetical protein
MISRDRIAFSTCSRSNNIVLCPSFMYGRTPSCINDLICRTGLPIVSLSWNMSNSFAIISSIT